MEDKPKNKKPTSVDILSQAPRRDSYDKSQRGSGSPNLNAGELRTSKAWREHKPAKQLPKKKA